MNEGTKYRQRARSLQIARTQARFGKEEYGVTRIGIFGSAARDQIKKNSDVDVVIEMKEPDLFYMVHIKEIIEKSLKCPVDIVRYRNNMNKNLKSRIDKESVYV